MTEDEIIKRLIEQNAGGRPSPALPEAVSGLEAVVGHLMPPLLRRVYLEVARIYLEVADGGFGRWGGALSFTEYRDEPPMNHPHWRRTSGGAKAMARTIRHRCTATALGLRYPVAPGMAVWL
ncbi:hypothetical protein [Kitasatospora sp. NPDC091276]|uniref:hypothetical protein n=1 Tax=Kitasatospora sp. NPDC091276 TaxID=3155300 RepID=UPI0034371C1B